MVQATVQAFAGPNHDHGVCIDSALDRAAALCRARGARLTEQRRRILEMVWASHAPVGAYALLERLSASGRRAAPPTVYRALEFLVEQGLVHRVESQNAYVGCPRPERPHDALFMLCECCGTAAELASAPVHAAIEAAATQHGFTVTSATADGSGAKAMLRAPGSGQCGGLRAGTEVGIV